ncbi:hypothetical protein CK203_008781 [Vitis vinifera]|uniref:Uncharacterized protein n=1 Tax=Vitis vinifera TaxID=29760 RepID=A0A438KE32_VITVI|nr:hypothetical protein CK203_008781 [Vitis vinifera]
MMLAPLEKKRLRLSPLDMRFHLRDLIGSGHVKTVHTPTGLVVRHERAQVTYALDRLVHNASYMFPSQEEKSGISIEVD